MSHTQTGYTHYICAYHDASRTIVRDLFTEDTSALDRFATEWDTPGHSIFECINPLKPGSRTRSIETVVQIEQVVNDIDHRALVTSPDEILDKILHLPVAATELVASGGGLHPKYRLKEPVGSRRT
jgi:alkanesulfonate monooxygenase SsuD/methylene tetrahydromethanopterin reductase-like flavin-dependent oxidoreductase (luciferase family)